MYELLYKLSCTRLSELIKQAHIKISDVINVVNKYGGTKYKLTIKLEDSKLKTYVYITRDDTMPIKEVIECIDTIYDDLRNRYYRDFKTIIDIIEKNANKEYKFERYCVDIKTTISESIYKKSYVGIIGLKEYFDDIYNNINGILNNDGHDSFCGAKSRINVDNNEISLSIGDNKCIIKYIMLIGDRRKLHNSNILEIESRKAKEHTFGGVMYNVVILLFDPENTNRKKCSINVNIMLMTLKCKKSSSRKGRKNIVMNKSVSQFKEKGDCRLDESPKKEVRHTPSTFYDRRKRC